MQWIEKVKYTYTTTPSTNKLCAKLYRLYRQYCWNCCRGPAFQSEIIRFSGRTPLRAAYGGPWPPGWSRPIASCQASCSPDPPSPSDSTRIAKENVSFRWNQRKYTSKCTLAELTRFAYTEAAESDLRNEWWGKLEISMRDCNSTPSGLNKAQVWTYGSILGLRV